MRFKKATKATLLGICAFTAACDSRTPEQTEATTRQELIAGAPMTLDARLIEKAGGKWNLMCIGRFRQLGLADTATYQSTITFFQEGATAALLTGQVTTAAPTFSRTALGNVLTITHPSVDSAGSFTVRMVRGNVDPRRRHTCNAIVKRNGATVMQSEARPPRQVTAPAGVFTDTGQLLGNADTMAVVMGDLDRDGDLDAVEGNYGASKRVWRNDGSGRLVDTGQSFPPQISYGLALGDLDGDGDLDLFEGSGPSNRVWNNNGTGALSDSGQVLGNHVASAVALGDLDGDGDLDVFQGGGYYQPSRVWRNNGFGTFQDTGQTLGALSITRSVALGDLDGDGDLDVFLGNAFYSGAGNRILLNNGSAVFSDSGQAPGTSNTYAAALGDLDGDGDLDAFCGNFDQPSTVFLNNGAGILANTNQALGNNHRTTAVALGDLDGDGDLDAFEAAFNQPKRIWLNNGAGTFSASAQALAASASFDVTLGDLDGDADLDALEGSVYGQPNRVWRNQ